MSPFFSSGSTDNDSLRELCDELKDLNKTFKQTANTNERVSRVLLAVAFAQIVIALFQFFASVKESEGNLIGIVTLVMLGVLVLFIFKEFLKDYKSDSR